MKRNKTRLRVFVCALWPFLKPRLRLQNQANLAPRLFLQFRLLCVLGAQGPDMRKEPEAESTAEAVNLNKAYREYRLYDWIPAAAK